jgi:hypothetical protein
MGLQPWWRTDPATTVQPKRLRSHSLPRNCEENPPQSDPFAVLSKLRTREREKPCGNCPIAEHGTKIGKKARNINGRF